MILILVRHCTVIGTARHNRTSRYVHTRRAGGWRVACCYRVMTVYGLASGHGVGAWVYAAFLPKSLMASSTQRQNGNDRVHGHWYAYGSLV